MKQVILFLAAITIVNFCMAQNVGIGTTTPHSSAMLDIKSNTKGILIPRTSSSSRTAIVNPAKGLMLYDTTTGSFWFHDGVQWIEAGRINVVNNNTFFGYQADNNNSIGTLNTGIGAQALFSNTIGSLNTATGVHAMYLNTTGTSNTADGSFTLEFNTTGINNTAIGSNALSSNTTGKENTVIGYNAMDANTTGNYNTSVGVTSMRSNTTGNYNTANGHQALYTNTTGYDNVAVGRNAMIQNQSGYSNVAVGSGTLFTNSSGNNNVGIGDSALFHFNGSGNFFNTAIGSKALFSSTAGVQNTAIGYQALYSNTSGSFNIAIGEGALWSNTNTHENVAIGLHTLQTNSGFGNTAIGSQTFFINNGNNNTGIGGSAVVGGDGSNNTIIGSHGYISGSNINYATVIGASSIVSCSNCLVLGGDNPSDRTKVGINIAAPFTDLHIIQQSDNVSDISRGIRLQRPNGNQWRTFIDPNNDYVFQLNNSLFSYIEPVGGTFISNSDERLKKDVQPMENALSKLMLLKPKTYHYAFNKDNDRRLYGFIAQDVEKLFPEFVFTSENGFKGIAYSNFSVITIKALQEQELKLREQQKENEQLKKELLQQQQLIADISKRLEELEKNKK